MEILVEKIKHVIRSAIQRNRLEYRKRRNITIDNHLLPISEGLFESLCNIAVLDLPESRFRTWIEKSKLPFRFDKFPHKKALEFFFSSYILEFNENDVILDAAGGKSGYLDAIKKIHGCNNLYLHDQIFPESFDHSSHVRIVGGDICSIDIPGSTITKISCHHSFEHFKGDKDTGFIGEVGRLLKPGGRACIIPLFLMNYYAECWNIDQAQRFDNRAELIIDKTATIPGDDTDGHFARFYDTDALTSRVLQPARHSSLKATLVICRLDGEDQPDMEKNFGSRLNKPLRALLLEKTC